MIIYQASKAILTRVVIECSRWGRLLIAVIVIDILLAAGAWYAVGCLIGE